MISKRTINLANKFNQLKPRIFAPPVEGGLSINNLHELGGYPHSAIFTVITGEFVKDMGENGFLL